MFDVSLESDDGHQIKAHKVILAAGSQFFKEVFEKNDVKNLLIYLKGIKGNKLKYVLDFL